MMNRFVYGDLGNPDIYLDEQHLRMARTMRISFNNLIRTLINEGQTDKARKAVEKSLEVLPIATIPYDYATTEMVRFCVQLGMDDTADMLMTGTYDMMIDRLEWYISLDAKQRNRVSIEMQPQQSVGLLQNVWFDLRNTNHPRTKQFEDAVQKYYYLVAR